MLTFNTEVTARVSKTVMLRKLVLVASCSQGYKDIYLPVTFKCTQEFVVDCMETFHSQNHTVH